MTDIKQIELDISILESKIENTFEFYPENTPPDIEAIQEDLEKAQDQNTIAQYSKYLAHVEGRQKCYTMRQLDRTYLFNALKKHREAQLEAYKYLQNKFKSYGGLLT